VGIIPAMRQAAGLGQRGSRRMGILHRFRPIEDTNQGAIHQNRGRALKLAT
jgi:hypothetical protein